MATRSRWLLGFMTRVSLKKDCLHLPRFVSMRRKYFSTSSGVSVPAGRAEILQACLENSRSEQKTTGASSHLPRSTKVGGRYIIDKKLFPDWVDRVQLSSAIKWKWDMRNKKAPVPSQEELERTLPVLTPDPETIARPPLPSDGHANVTWLGHACCLTQWQGWSVLCDPIFSERCAPVQWAGPARVRYHHSISFNTCI